MKPKKLARNFNKSKSRFILKVNGRVAKFGPEFNSGFWCVYCKHKFNCSWVDYYDCLDYSHRTWFGHLDIGRVLE